MLVIALVLLMSFAAVAEERYLEFTHYSEVLGKEKKFAVILPPDYTTEIA